MSKLDDLITEARLIEEKRKEEEERLEEKKKEKEDTKYEKKLEESAQLFWRLYVNALSKTSFNTDKEDTQNFIKDINLSYIFSPCNKNFPKGIQLCIEHEDLGVVAISSPFYPSFIIQKNEGDEFIAPYLYKNSLLIIIGNTIDEKRKAFKKEERNNRFILHPQEYPNLLQVRDELRSRSKESLSPCVRVIQGYMQTTRIKRNQLSLPCLGDFFLLRFTMYSRH